MAKITTMSGPQCHKSSVNLLAVPCYSDLLEDIDAKDESDCGWALMNSDMGWRTKMAKWIGDAHTVGAAKDSDSDGNVPAPNAQIPAAPSWSVPLTVLFGGTVCWNPRQLRLLCGRQLVCNSYLLFDLPFEILTFDIQH